MVEQQNRKKSSKLLVSDPTLSSRKDIRQGFYMRGPQKKKFIRSEFFKPQFLSSSWSDLTPLCTQPNNFLHSAPILVESIQAWAIGEKREVKTFKTKKMSDKREIRCRNMIRRLFHASLKFLTHQMSGDNDGVVGVRGGSLYRQSKR